MRIFLSLLGILGAYLLLRFRESIGNTVGEADWMRKVGGVYNFVILIAILLFFWSLAELTGSTDVLFAPFSRLPGTQQPAEEVQVEP